jgi:allophanate hydrolase subunit 1
VAVALAASAPMCFVSVEEPRQATPWRKTAAQCRSAMASHIQERTMEEFTLEFDALEARRKAALEKLRTTTDQNEIKRLQDELVEIDSAFATLGEEDA